jgi:4-nitrophenyl phosphatase
MKNNPSVYRNIRALILDMDGVLWRDHEPIGNLPAIFERLQELGISTVLATNNSTRTIAQYLQKISGFGVALQPWQIVTSSQATVKILKDKFPDGGSVFVVGEQALVDTLAESGFIPSEYNAIAVVAGMDRTISYQKMRIASTLIRTGIPFIGTNPDLTFPTPEGLAPGAGAILASIEAASGVKPVIAGKPSPLMYQLAMDRLGTTPDQTLVVGDRPETDIVGGQQLMCRTALVLSGVTNRQQAYSWNPRPDLILNDLTQVVENLGANLNQ